MLKVDIINCKTKNSTMVLPFTKRMASESITADNIGVFEDLNINQLGLKKEDL